MTSKILKKLPVEDFHMTTVETPHGPMTVSQWPSMTDAEAIEFAEISASITKLTKA